MLWVMQWRIKLIHYLLITDCEILKRKLGIDLNNKTKNDLASLPLIGVSLMKEKGQTFVFNESALERILIQNSKLFKRVEFFDSNFSKERKIAIFYK